MQIPCRRDQVRVPQQRLQSVAKSPPLRKNRVAKVCRSVCGMIPARRANFSINHCTSRVSSGYPICPVCPVVIQWKSMKKPRGLAWPEAVTRTVEAPW
jgi:hypothetical protein